MACETGPPLVPRTVTPVMIQATRILLVEDHEDTLAAMARLLRRRGYAVTTANCVTVARLSAETAEFDLVLSDIGLPDGNGCDLMVVLSTRYGLKGIAMSGYNSVDDRLRSLAAGFLAHLSKPVTVGDIEAAIAFVHSPAAA